MTVNKKNKYEILAFYIIDMIKKKIFRCGERLPSVRQMSKDKKVSTTTVLQSYRLLEDLRFIEARPQSGFYVCDLKNNVTNVNENNPLDLSQMNRTDLIYFLMEKQNNPHIVQLGYIRPDPKLLPVDKISSLLSSSARRYKLGCIEYDDLKGYYPLRNQISKHLLLSGCTINPEDIIITSGSDEAVMLSLMSICKREDRVAIESPVCFHFIQLLKILDIRFVEIPINPERGLVLEALEDAILDEPIKALLVTPCFNTPTGYSMSDSNKKELISLSLEYEFQIIEYDSSGDIYFTEDRPISLKSLDEYNNVIYCSSFSNTIAPGYRIGWIATNKNKHIIESCKLIGNYQTPMPSQVTISEFLHSGYFIYHMRRIRKIYSDRMTTIITSILNTFPESVKTTNPKGGISLWVKLPYNINSLDLLYKAIQHGISFNPGFIFTRKNKYLCHFHINTAIWSETIAKCISKLGELCYNLIT
jgi:DNA-binding transcriptional MocR family regulator